MECKRYRIEIPTTVQEEETVQILSLEVSVKKDFAPYFADGVEDYASQVHDVYALIDTLEGVIHRMMCSASPLLKVTAL